MTTEKKIVTKDNFQEAIGRVNDWTLQELRESDALFNRDMKKAEKFRDSAYNKYAEPGDENNADIMRQYNILVRQALDRYDERINTQNEKHMKIIGKPLERSGK